MSYSYRIKTTTCPHCGKHIDASTTGDETGRVRGPSPGDLSLCVYCVEFSVFDEEMRPRKMTAEEAANTEMNPVAQSIRNQILNRAKSQVSNLH